MMIMIYKGINDWSYHTFWDMVTWMPTSGGKSMLDFLRLVHFRMRNYGGFRSIPGWALNASLNSQEIGLLGSLPTPCRRGSSFTGNWCSLCFASWVVWEWWKWQALARMKHSEQPFLQAATWLQYAADGNPYSVVQTMINHPLHHHKWVV